MHSRLFARAFAGALATLASAAAVADQAYASVSLSDLRVTLYDLRPDDGIAPAILFDKPSQPSNFSVSGGSGVGSNLNLSGDSGSFQGFYDVASRLAAGQAYAGGVQAQGDPTSAQGRSLGVSASSKPGVQVSARADYANPGLNFELSPGTLMVFGGTADVIAAAARTSVAGAFSSAEADVTLSLYSRSFEQSDASNAFQLRLKTSGTAGGVKHLSTALEVTFANATSEWLPGQLFEQYNVSTHYDVGAVPEPAPAALLLTGLGALGGMARRRAARPVAQARRISESPAAT